MSDKIIFLDFDGVLNTEFYQGRLRFEGRAWRDEFGAVFAPAAVRSLRRIVDATGADIVVESSWKYLGLDAMQEMWRVRQLPGKVIDITPNAVSDEWLLSANLDEFDPAIGLCKGMEIAAWLKENHKENANYVIIDDEHVALKSQMSHFILTNPYDGLTEEDANRAIDILNRK